MTGGGPRKYGLQVILIVGISNYKKIILVGRDYSQHFLSDSWILVRKQIHIQDPSSDNQQLYPSDIKCSQIIQPLPSLLWFMPVKAMW